MDDNKKEKDEKKPNITDEEIEKAKKEMDELMKSIKDEMGMNNVKVVKVQIPRASFKHFIISLIVSLIMNTLLIVGTSGFIDFVIWENVLDLILFSIYFSIIERIINLIFLKFFTPLIIRTMGLAALIPIVISLALVMIFPIFVIIENVVLTLIVLVFVCVCKSYINSFIQNKFLFKPRRKK